MNIKEQIDYVVYVFTHNLIRPNEIEYYSGKTGKNPYGIEDKIWAKYSYLIKQRSKI